MSRINSNISSLIGQRVLAQQQAGLTKTLERLSTGYRINRGGDDPAGLIASERLRSEKAAIEAAIGNAERADQIVNVAEGGLQEVSSLLLELQGLVSEVASDAGMSLDEKTANQVQIDSILQTIDRIAATTSFAGTKLLNGNYDFDVTGVSAVVSGYEIRGAKFAAGGTLAVNAVVTTSAQHGTLFVSAGGGTALDLNAASASFTFEVRGSEGVKQFSYSSGTTLATIAAGINTFADVTGVSAVASGNYLELKSTGFGSDEFVSFKVVDNTLAAGGAVYGATALGEDTIDATDVTLFSAATSPVKDSGQDIVAAVNGIKAQTNGKTISVSNEQLDMEIVLSDTQSQTAGSKNILTINGGGARFNLGPEANLNNQVLLGIKNVTTTSLGSTSTAFLNTLASGGDQNAIDGDITTAQQAIDKAIDQIAGLRGRLGAFQSNVIGGTIRSLGVTLENTTAAESAIRDTDFAEATAELARNQILVQAASSVLAISNAQSQNVLLLL